MVCAKMEESFGKNQGFLNALRNVQLSLIQGNIPDNNVQPLQYELFEHFHIKTKKKQENI